MRRISNVSQIEQLQTDLQLMSKNTQNIQDELDNAREIFLDKKVIMHDRLDKCLENIQKLRKKKKNLLQTIKDMKIKQKAKKKTQQKLKSRIQSLEKTLKRSKDDYEAILRKHLEEQRSSQDEESDEAEIQVQMKEDE